MDSDPPTALSVNDTPPVLWVTEALPVIVLAVIATAAELHETLREPVT